MYLKICGLRQPDNIRAVAATQPDYLGFIFYEKSPRYVGDHWDGAALADLPCSPQLVGVFVDAPVRTVLDKARRYGLHFVQLHGRETPAYCAEVAAAIPVIKAFGIDESFDFTATEGYAASCRYFLFDTKTPRHGGSGRRFDWALLDGYHGDTPVFLSGGLDLDDIARARHLPAALPLHAVDVNSRFELAPGLKDVDKILLIKSCNPV